MTDTPPLRGMIPPIPTFFGPDGTLDEDAHAALVDGLVGNAVDGVLVLGTAGEGPALPQSVRSATVSTAVDSAAGRVPVIVGCGAQTPTAALAQLDDAAARGAAGAFVLPPFYYRLAQSALVAFFEGLAERAPIPVALYHIPALTNNGLELDAVRRLAEHPRVLGMKDSGRDFSYHLALLDEVAGPDFAVFQGVAPLAHASLVAGSRDLVCTTSAVAPAWERELRDAVAITDASAARAAAHRIRKLAELFNSDGYPLPVNLKAIAWLLGLGPARPHEGCPSVGRLHLDRLAAALDRLGLAVTDAPTDIERVPTSGGRP